MLRKLLIGLLVVVPVLRWSIGCSSTHPDTISQLPGGADLGAVGDAGKPEKPLSPIQSAKLCVQTAKQLEAAGYFADALAQYERARRFNPTDFTIGHRIAILQDRLGDANNAALEYELAMRNQPNNPDLINDYGYFHYSKGRWDRAEQLFRKALACKADHQRAIVNLAMTLAQENRYEESVRYFEKVVSPSAARSNLAMMQAQQGKLELAHKTIDQALVLNPDLAQAQAMKRYISEQEKRAAAAPAKAGPAYALRKVEESAPEKTAEKNAEKPAARVAAAQTKKFTPVVAEPVIQPKRVPQIVAAPMQTTTVQVVAETPVSTPAPAPAPAPVADSDSGRSRLSGTATPAPAPTPLAVPAAPIERATPRIDLAPTPAKAAELPAASIATPAPADLPPVIAQVPQRKMIAPVGIRPAREEELAENTVATPAPAAIAPMVTPATVSAPVAQLALADLPHSTMGDVVSESKHEKLEALTLVDPAVSASIRRFAEDQPVVIVDTPKNPTSLRAAEATPMIESATPTVRGEAPVRDFVVPAEKPFQVAAATPSAPAPAAAALAPMIEPVQPSAPRVELPAEPVRVARVESATPAPEALAANVIIAPAEMSARPPAAEPAVTHTAPDADSGRSRLSGTATPAPTATPIIEAAAITPAAPILDSTPIVTAAREVPAPKPVEIAAAPVAAPAPAPQPQVTNRKAAGSATVWVENNSTSRFTKGRGPNLLRKGG